MDKVDEVALGSIEALLVAERLSVRDALLGAYNLGFNEGALRMARAGQAQAEQLLKAMAP